MYRSLVFAVLISLPSLAAYAEQYVVPIWAAELPSSDGTWWTQAVVINPHPFDVTFQVTGTFPLATRPCASCTATAADVVTIAPHASAIVRPLSGRAGEALVGGAFELQTSAPVKIQLVAYRPGEREIRQRLDVAHGWLSPGTHSVSAVESPTRGVRLNVFITNPSQTPIDVAIWALSRAENEVHASIPPMSTRAIRLPDTLCAGRPCAVPGTFPPVPLQVQIESNGSFLATVSSVASTWAVFSLPDATEAH